MKREEKTHNVEEYTVTVTRSYIGSDGQRARIGQPLIWRAVLDLGIAYRRDQIVAMLLQKCEEEIFAKLREEDETWTD